MSTIKVDEIQNSAGTNAKINLTTTEVVMNEDGLSTVDTRVEGDTDANLLFCDASTDKVGIGTSSPDSKLHVHASSAGTLTPNANGDDLVIESSASTGMTIASGTSSKGTIFFATDSLPTQGYIEYDQSTEDLKIGTNNADSVTINSSQKVGVNQSSPGARFESESVSTSSGEIAILGTGGHTSYTGSVFKANCIRSVTSVYSFFEGVSDSDGTPDTEVILRGDGTILSDGGTTTPADYAEYFESIDGNSIEFGKVVMLFEGKIKVIESESDKNKAIGVIRPVGTSSIVANSSWGRWNEKYLKSPYGAYLLDENGDRKLNPDYDPNHEYIPREKRDEWNIVGLLGQIPINKDQIIPDHWIFMFDVNEDVAMYFVK